MASPAGAGPSSGVDAETAGRIAQIRDVLPGYGDGFLAAALQARTVGVCGVSWCCTALFMSSLSIRHTTGMQQAPRHVCQCKLAAWHAARPTCVSLRMCHAQALLPACPAALWRPRGPGGGHPAERVPAAGACGPRHPGGRGAAAAAASCAQRRCIQSSIFLPHSAAALICSALWRSCAPQLKCHVSRERARRAVASPWFNGMCGCGHNWLCCTPGAASWQGLAADAAAAGQAPAARAAPAPPAAKPSRAAHKVTVESKYTLRKCSANKCHGMCCRQLSTHLHTTTLRLQQTSPTHAAMLLLGAPFLTSFRDRTRIESCTPAPFQSDGMLNHTCRPRPGRSTRPAA